MRGKRPLRRPTRRWEVKLIFKKCCGGVDWIDVARNSERLCVFMNAVMNRRVLENAGNFLTSSRTVSLLRRIPLHGSSRLVSYKTKYSLHI